MSTARLDLSGLSYTPFQPHVCVAGLAGHILSVTVTDYGASCDQLEKEIIVAAHAYNAAWEELSVDEKLDEMDLYHAMTSRTDKDA